MKDPSVSTPRSSWQPWVTTWLPWLLWMAFLYAMSAQPEVPGPGDKGSLLRDIFNYSAHAASYALLALLSWRVACFAKPWLPRWMARHPGPIAGFWSALYAVSDEYHQNAVPGRTASLWDLAVDLIGIVAMLAVLAYWEPRRVALRRALARGLGVDRG